MNSATGYPDDANIKIDMPAEVLAFTLGDEEYGIDIQNVQELRGYAAVTRIANAPDHIKGVINLRGIVVPIIDMRIKFKLGTPDYSPLTVVIILSIGNHVVGMVVDSVSDVLSLDAHHIKPAPPIAAKNDMDYLLGLATIDDRMVILLDVKKMLTEFELIELEKVAA